MQLTIRRNQGDKRDVKLIRMAVPFMLKRLLKPSLVNEVTLHISLTSLQGDCGDIGIEDAPKFKMRLHHEMDTLLLMVTLAHELVHLSQVMDGRLKIKEINDLTTWFWKRKSYGSDPYASGAGNLPWEIDAESREGDLACQFFTHYVTMLNAG